MMVGQTWECLLHLPRQSLPQPAFACIDEPMKRLCLFALLLLISAHAADIDPALRVNVERLKAIHDARLNLAQKRSIQHIPVHGLYDDFRAVIATCNAQTNRTQLVEAAKKAGVQVLLCSGYPQGSAGLQDGVLVLCGTQDASGTLRFPSTLPGGNLRIAAMDQRGAGFNAMQVATRSNEKYASFFKRAASDKAALRALTSTFEKYPHEFLAAFSVARPDLVELYDDQCRDGLVCVAGTNDLRQSMPPDGALFDPLAVSMLNVCTHLLARDSSEREIRSALRDGHAYVSHDWLCDPTGFVFAAANNLGLFPMGDSAPHLLGNSRIVAFTPVEARIKLFHNGIKIKEVTSNTLDISTDKEGVYRVEAWLDIAGEAVPWIYSNAVRLEGPSIAMLAAQKLPSYDPSPDVIVKKDVSYVNGKPDDEAKHQLDIFTPKDRKEALPVLFFIHGGAWRTGDRSQYFPMGNRFAKDGLVTVLPSYRLAPKYPHPAQIEDVAAALAWVYKNIAEHGGDPRRIYVGGHSAGGHLSSLVTLDERYLKVHALSPQIIRGTIALSGVYDLVAIGTSQEAVFGKDQNVRRDGSPQFHIKEGAGPFLVSYCQWDYPTLPAQGRNFHAALLKAGIQSELLYVPKENHISEMIAVNTKDDPSAQAILKFIKDRN